MYLVTLTVTLETLVNFVEYKRKFNVFVMKRQEHELGQEIKVFEGQARY